MNAAALTRLFLGLLAAAILCSPLITAAQQASDPACEWSECSSSSTAAAPAAPAPPAAALPACTGSDRFECSGDCRDVFDTQFHHCLAACLAKKCSEQPAERKEESYDARADKSACLQVESAACNGECRLSRSAEQPRCRRDCLQRRCPEASRYDTAAESVDPGTLRCKRCRADNERYCYRRCRGTRTSSNAWQNTLSGMGCEQLCFSTKCGAGCSSILP